MTDTGRTVSRVVAVWAIHAMVLALLIAADGPFARFYRGFHRWACNSEEEKIESVKGQPGLSAVLNTVSNDVSIGTRTIPLGAGERLNVYVLHKTPDSWHKSLAEKLLSTEFWLAFQQIGTFYIGVILCFFIWNHDPSRRREVLGCVVGLIAGVIMVWFIQHMVGKLRIREAQWVPVYMAFPTAWGRASGFSFPSGHTTAAFVMATFLAGLYPRTRWAFYVLAAGCGVARIILQQHWISDVYAGALLGHSVMRAVRYFLHRRFPEMSGRA